MDNHFSQSDLLNISENLLTLRRRLMISQKEMIKAYFSDERSSPMISVATLSNIENGYTVGVQHLVHVIAKKTGVDCSTFCVDPDVFAKNVGLFFKASLEAYENDTANNLPRMKKASNVDTVVQELSNYLMDAMIRGELRPGSKIPSDRELGILLGTGRTPVREALKVLSTLGIINISQGKGTFIASNSTQFFLLPLTWSFFIGENSIEHLMDVRNVLEIESARLAAEIADKDAITVLTEIYSKMEIAFQDADFQTFLDLDLDFHLAIAACSHNPIIINLLTTSRKLLSYISKSGMISMQHLRDVFTEHGKVYKEITESRPGGAKQAMETHLTNARNRYTINK